MPTRALAAALAIGLIAAPPVVMADGRYQAVPVPESADFGSGKVLILDTQTGQIWTWSEVAASPGGPGGRFLIYQGQVKPGRQMGDIIESQEWGGRNPE
jgi:hypothetical protein